MHPPALGPRLAALAGLVTSGARLVDVGTDHALLPVSLLLQKTVESAIATDIRSGPLKNARRTALRYSVPLDLRLCDGLSGVGAGEVDTVVIAGMGGESVSRILQDAPWTKTGPALILQPMTRSEMLRLFLAHNGYAIHSEHLACENRRIFVVLRAMGGEMRLSPAEAYTGLGEPVTGAEYYPAYLSAVRTRLLKEHIGLAAGGSERRRDELADIIREIDERRARYAEGS